MMHTTQALYDNLGSTLLEINKQIDAVKRDAMNSFPVHEKPDPDDVYKMKNRFGNFILTDLLAAKAQCVSAMASLKATTVRTR